MISVIIPNYNGKKLLQRYLADNLAVLAAQGIIDVIISDDASSDDSVSYVREHFPEVTMVENKHNLGFSKNCNVGAKAATQPYLFFLNSDIKIEHLDVSAIKKEFEDEQVFSLVPKVFVPSKAYYESLTTLTFEGGYFLDRVAECTDEGDLATSQLVAWPCGGAMIADAKKFNALEGFDPIFSPFHFEDIDLGYRASRRGWKNLYAPIGSVLHLQHATILTNFKKKWVGSIQTRNRYLFNWRAISTPYQFCHHVLALMFVFLTFKLTDIKAVFAAIRQLWQYRKT